MQILITTTRNIINFRSHQYQVMTLYDLPRPIIKPQVHNEEFSHFWCPTLHSINCNLALCWSYKWSGLIKTQIKRAYFCCWFTCTICLLSNNENWNNELCFTGVNYLHATKHQISHCVNVYVCSAEMKYVIYANLWSVDCFKKTLFLQKIKWYFHIALNPALWKNAMHFKIKGIAHTRQKSI